MASSAGADICRLELSSHKLGRAFALAALNGPESLLRFTSPPGIRAETISRMKGHEDGGYVLWTGGSSSGTSSPGSGPGAFRHDP